MAVATMDKIVSFCCVRSASRHQRNRLKRREWSKPLRKPVLAGGFTII